MKRRITTSLLLLITLSIVISGCNKNRIAIPKPKSYFRIDMPEHDYKELNKNYPYNFEYSSHANVQLKDPNKPNWLNINYDKNKATIYLTYKPIEDNLVNHTERTRELVYKHTIKADAINEAFYNNDSTNTYGALYFLKGNVASNIQFYITDSVNHFIRGSLYFNTRPNKDSLAPVIDYIKEDIIHIMETTTWN